MWLLTCGIFSYWLLWPCAYFYFIWNIYVVKLNLSLLTKISEILKLNLLLWPCPYFINYIFSFKIFKLFILIIYNKFIKMYKYLYSYFVCSCLYLFQTKHLSEIFNSYYITINMNGTNSFHFIYLLTFTNVDKTILF